MRSILGELGSRDIDHTVFLGDYLNKGPESAQVIEHLIEVSELSSISFLLGNHEAAFLQAMESGDLRLFLKMGGAATIRSYVGGDVGPDVMAELRVHVPVKHISFLGQMPMLFQGRDIVASHKPLSKNDSRYRVSAHISVGPVLIVGRSSRTSTQAADLRQDV